MKELNNDELENATGGFIYKGYDGHKLNGVDIICPSCGFNFRPLIKTVNGEKVNSALFYCYLCHKYFEYTYEDGKILSKCLKK